MKIAIVILNWNGKKFLEQFLPLVIKHSAGAEIYVADNASTDGSVEYLVTHFPNIKIIKNPKNEGFCRGYNLALKQVATDYYVLLNSDVEVSENWLLPAIDYLEKNPSVAACQPKIKSYSNREYFEYAGAAGGFLDADGYPFCRGRLFETLEKDENQYEQITEIGWASGACLFVRVKVFWQLDGLDEDFFAHMEEIDFCWRVWNAGYKIMYFPQSVIYHVGGGTLPKNSARKTFLNFRNSLYLLHKNYPGKSMALKIFKRLILDGIAGAKFLIQGYPKDTLAVIKAHFAYYKSIPTLQSKRKGLKHNSTKVLMPYSIVWKYFIEGKKKFTSLP